MIRWSAIIVFPIAFILLNLPLTCLSADVYMWTDENGNPVVSSEKPPEHIKDFEIIEGSDTAVESDPPGAQASSSGPSGNPIARIDRAMAKEDLKKELLDTYEDSYSTVEMLLKGGMRDFDTLSKIPSSEVSDGVLKDLVDTYYPSFSTILMLYESNMKSYKNIQD